jgi:hypothetical protein
LRLIAMKFLEFEELANYNFQNEFLKPFEEVAKTRSRNVREHVIDCLCTMIAALPKNIKSGWACILNVFASQVGFCFRNYGILKLFSVFLIKKGEEGERGVDFCNFTKFLLGEPFFK